MPSSCCWGKGGPKGTTAQTGHPCHQWASACAVYRIRQPPPRTKRSPSNGRWLLAMAEGREKLTYACETDTETSKKKGNLKQYIGCKRQYRDADGVHIRAYSRFTAYTQRARSESHVHLLTRRDGAGVPAGLERQSSVDPSEFRKRFWTNIQTGYGRECPVIERQRSG